jgi:hypothetical protein
VVEDAVHECERAHPGCFAPVGSQSVPRVASAQASETFLAGCLGLVNTGDRATLGATFTVSPEQAITSP